MSVLEFGKGHIRLCSCGCNRPVSKSTEWRHKNRRRSLRSLPVQPESPPPPKRRRIAHFQAESPIITPGKQKQTRISSSSHSRVDDSDHPQFFSFPQLHAPSFDESDTSLPLLDPPPASNLLQPPGDALTEASGRVVDDVLLNLHTRTHRTDQTDDEDPEGTLEGDVEAADYADHETDDFFNGEDVAVEGDADPREGIVSDWDLLTEEFIVEAEELSKFGHSLLHTS
jgi:hypothetical protein